MWLDPGADRALAFTYPGRFVSLGFDPGRVGVSGHLCPQEA
jgi:hypothetical protein